MSAACLPSSLLQAGGILFFASCVGWAVASALLPGGGRWTPERWGWSIAIAPLLLALHVLVTFSVGLHPGWIAFLALAFCGIVLARSFRLPRSDRASGGRSWLSPTPMLLLALTVAGISIYIVRSLSEPMWSNDFLAVWGLKGKTIFGDSGIPQRLFRWPEFEFSNPAYPIGLPLVYAGIAFLLDRWDDHAMALLFPFFQVGTLLVLVGWLQRRGVKLVVALAAAAFVANFGVLYSAWLTGMAEVPAAFAFLLVGTALSDVVDETDPGSVRRLFLASLAAAATKNEGVFLVGIAWAFLVFLAVRRRERRLWVGAAAVLIPGLGSVLLHRLFLGSHPIRGLDLALLWRPGLGDRVVETLREEWTQLARPIWPGIVAAIALPGLGSRRAGTNPILVVASASLVSYLALPVLCPFGPGWLIHWTVGRITGALVPLLAAGIGMAWCERGEAPSSTMNGSALRRDDEGDSMANRASRPAPALSRARDALSLPLME
jgi:hypothetical protein